MTWYSTSTNFFHFSTQKIISVLISPNVPVSPNLVISPEIFASRRANKFHYIEKNKKKLLSINTLLHIIYLKYCSMKISESLWNVFQYLKFFFFESNFALLFLKTSCALFSVVFVFVLLKKSAIKVLCLLFANKEQKSTIYAYFGRFSQILVKIT